MTDVIVTQVDIARALKHLGFDSVEDLHYWVADVNDLNRFDALCLQLAEHRQSAQADTLAVIEEALRETEAVQIYRSNCSCEPPGHDPSCSGVRYAGVARQFKSPTDARRAITTLQAFIDRAKGDE